MREIIVEMETGPADAEVVNITRQDLFKLELQEVIINVQIKIAQ
jgi:hypothetical protein